jgi:uncharacterized flavoprotein (TIGR03862 family)
MHSKTIHIIGAGPSGMFAAYCLQKEGFEVHLYDQKPALARKFLVAGHNGLNLTNAKPLEAFISKYPDQVIQNAVKEFTPDDLRSFFLDLGVETFVGTSGKVYPILKYKPIDVLEIWRKKLLELGVKIHANYTLKSVSLQHVEFSKGTNTISTQTETVLFALGGASWKSTGTDGKWVELLKQHLNLVPFQASNAGFVLKDWSKMTEFAGLPIKNSTINLRESTQKGEFVITDQGIEGGPVYALNYKFREGTEILYIDFKPDLSEEVIYAKLVQAKNNSEGLKQLKLAKGSIGIIKTILSKETFTDKRELSKLIKAFPLHIEKLYEMDKAISTVGGIPLNALDENFRCTAHPNWYFIGEMVDWDAPTGGYLLQACFSMAFMASKNIAQTFVSVSKS